jgi:hypothetical protein
MNRYLVAIAVLAIAATATGRAAQTAPPGADPAANGPQVSQATPRPAVPPIYIPPRRGAPVDVAPAATRSPLTQAKLKLLAPEHVGLTVSARPTLYMYVADKGHLQVLVTRSAEPGGPKVASGRVDVAEAPAIGPLDLGELKVELEPGTDYRVTLTFFDRGGSVRATESTVVRRVAEPIELAAITAGADSAARARAYASSGVWFDAIESISRAIAAEPTAPGPRQDRAALLEQAGLPEIASFDRNAAIRR